MIVSRLNYAAKLLISFQTCKKSALKMQKHYADAWGVIVETTGSEGEVRCFTMQGQCTCPCASKSRVVRMELCLYLCMVLNFMAYDIHDNRTVPSDSWGLEADRTQCPAVPAGTIPVDRVFSDTQVGGVHGNCFLSSSTYFGIEDILTCPYDPVGRQFHSA